MDKDNEWPVGRLRHNKANPRSDLKGDGFDELVASIKAQGVLQPLLITSDGTVWAGNRRLLAVQQLKLATVPVRVLPERDNVGLDLVPLIENLMRSALVPIDIIDYLSEFRTRWNLNATEIALMTGISKTTTYQYLRIADGPEAIKQMIAEDRIGLNAALELLKHADGEVLKVLSQREQVSLREAKEMVAKLKQPISGATSNSKTVLPITSRSNVITHSGFMFYCNQVIQFLGSDLCDLKDSETVTKLKELHGRIGPAIEKSKVPPKPVKISTGDRMKHPAIQAFKTATGMFPKRMLFDKVIETLGDEPDVTRLNQVFVAWTARGYNPQNLNLLDWYINGVPTTNGRSNGKGYETASSRNVRRLGESLEHIAGIQSTDRAVDS